MSVEDRSLRLLPVVSRPVLRLQLQSDVCRVIVKYLSVVNAKIFQDLPFKKIVPIFPQVFFLQNIQVLFCTAKKIMFWWRLLQGHAPVWHKFTPNGTKGENTGAFNARSFSTFATTSTSPAQNQLVILLLLRGGGFRNKNVQKIGMSPTQKQPGAWIRRRDTPPVASTVNFPHSHDYNSYR